MQYIKKAIPVEAFQWNGECPLNIAIHSVYSMPDGGDVGAINTLEGTLNIKTGDWIVGPGHRGEYWPVQDDIFRATYEPVAA